MGAIVLSGKANDWKSGGFNILRLLSNFKSVRFVIFFFSEITNGEKTLLCGPILVSRIGDVG